MTTRSRSVLLACIGVLLVAAVVAVVLLAGADSPAPVDSDSLAVSAGSAAGQMTAEGEGVGEAADAALAPTEPTSSGASGSAPRRKDTAATPPAPDVETPVDEQQRYLDETRAIVDDNEAALAAAVQQAIGAITGDDADALADMVAPDEGGATGYASALLDRYPAIVDSVPAGNVSVFTDGVATIYFAYAVVSWEDAGITSQHTISLMFRFVDGEWYLTTIGDTGENLRFVQSVTL